jgi:CO/xanthine dehydrogenase FAD-binding subunit
MSMAFARPATVAECIALLEREPSAKLLAGGTDLAVESNLRATRWPRLVSVEAIDELHASTRPRSRVRIGAGNAAGRNRPTVVIRAGSDSRVVDAVRVSAHPQSRGRSG